MLKHYQNVTFALKSSRLVNPNTFAELRDKTTCHAGIDMPASFADPVCNLIKEGVIPVTGNHIESFSDFVQESCVPGEIDVGLGLGLRCILFNIGCFPVRLMLD